MKTIRVILLLLLIPALLFSQVKIIGKVLGADGKVPLAAHVHLKNYDLNIRDVIKTVPVAKDGSFEITADEINAYYLAFTAPYHEYLLVPLILEGKMEPLNLEVKLKTLPYKNEFDEVKIIGDWNDFNFQTSEPMTKQADGTFIYEKEVAADTLVYQLIGLTTRMRSVNGTQTDRFIYDGGGDYRSLINVANGKAKIVFDPKKLLRISEGKNQPVVTFKNNRIYQELWDMDQLIAANREKYLDGMAKYRKEHENIKDYSYDWSPVSKILKQKMENDPSLLVRQFAGCELASLLMYRVKVDSSDLAKVGEMLPLESPLWATLSSLPMMVTPDRKKMIHLLEQLKDRNPIKRVRAFALSNLAMMAEFKDEKEKVKEYYEELKEKYSDVKEVQYTLKRLNPDKKIRVGAKVPDFEVQLLDSQEKISNKSLLGKFYLLDFWATWCGPCVGEMENLHKAYEQFKDKMEFISLSLDSKKEAIGKFRAQKWKMPWIHAYLNEDPNKEIAKIFEVMAIPRPILVNPQGVIIAMEGKLRGERLMETLTQLVK